MCVRLHDTNIILFYQPTHYQCELCWKFILRYLLKNASFIQVFHAFGLNVILQCTSLGRGLFCKINKDNSQKIPTQFYKPTSLAGLKCPPCIRNRAWLTIYHAGTEFDGGDTIIVDSKNVDSHSQSAFADNVEVSGCEGGNVIVLFVQCAHSMPI